jgi:hypothetical protein
MLKKLCLGMLSLSLTLPTHATSLAKILSIKHHQAKVLKAKMQSEAIEIPDYSGHWVGTLEGEQVDLVIEQTENNIEINGNFFEFNGLNSRSLASLNGASSEHYVFEKQADGRLVFTTVIIEKFYFEKGLIQQQIYGEMSLEGEKLMLKFEIQGEAPVVIEFRKA